MLKMGIGLNEGCGLGVHLAGEGFKFDRIFGLPNFSAPFVPCCGYLNGKIQINDEVRLATPS